MEIPAVPPTKPHPPRREGCTEEGCRYSRQELLAEKDKRLHEEGKGTTPHPRSADYIVHYEGGQWLCSAKGCRHPINVHLARAPVHVDETYTAIQISLCRTSGHSDLPPDERAKVDAIKSRVDKNPCACCGTTSNVTAAHVLVSMDDLTVAGMTKEEYMSRGNFIPLCGNKGLEGSCHHAFDTARLSFVQDPATMTWHTVYDDRYPFTRKPMGVPKFPNDPFRRALRFRTTLLQSCPDLQMTQGIDTSHIAEYVKTYTPPKVGVRGASHRVPADAVCEFDLVGCETTVVKRVQGKCICKSCFQQTVLPEGKKRPRE
eukprot:PhM_4_TR15937/c0_g1_i1/m.205